LTIGPDPVVVIPGASSIGQLEANAAAADIILSRDEQQALAAAPSEVRASTGEELRRG
jgi:aryl-alcohol dehydrogenase-like predicted oxidoreductase